MAKTGIILGVAIVAAVVLIGGGIWVSQQPPRPFVFDIAFYNLGRLNQPRPELKVLINGVETPVAGTRDGDPFVTATGGIGKELNAGVLPQIAVQYRYACGWKAVKIQSIDLPRDDQVELAKEEGYNTPLCIAVSEDGAVATLYIDDRGQPAHTLSVGGAMATIAANSSTSVDLAADMRCAAGRTAALGKSLSDLPNDPPRSTTTTHFLFDASGKRCYIYRQVSYVEENDPAVIGPDASPQVFHFAGANLYALPDGTIDFFLTEPPAKIVVPENQMMLGMAYIQTSLVETPCAGAGKRKAR
jgi:hypothetical protein